MTTLYALFFTVLGVVLLAWVIRTLVGPRPLSEREKLVRSMRKADHLIYHRNGSVSVDVEKMFRHPKVQKDLRNVGKLYKFMVIQALRNGERPPHQYGDMLPMNKDRLLIEWNDKWQAALDEVGISYAEFFDIPEDDEPLYTKEHDDSTTYNNWIHVYGGKEERS